MGAAVALGCAACSSVSAPAPLGRDVGGPILTIVTSVRANPQGAPVGLTQYFPTTSRSVAGVVELGKLASGTQVTLSWSRLSPSGSAQQIFSKTLPASSYGFADSSVVSTGPMQVGIYRFSATIGSVTKNADWNVYLPPHTAVADAKHTSDTLKLGPTVSHAAPPTPQNPCNHLRSIVTMPNPEHVHLSVAAYCPQTKGSGPVRGAELATMSKLDGNYLIGSLHRLKSGMITGNFVINVCKLPGGTDLPKSVLYVSTLILYGGYSRNFAGGYPLPAPHGLPNVTITSSVPPGTPVYPGEVITLKVTGADPTTLGPQLGIRMLRLYGPSGRIRSKSYRAASGCDSSALTRTMTVKYTVPGTTGKVLTLKGAASSVPGHSGILEISFPVSG